MLPRAVRGALILLLAAGLLWAACGYKLPPKPYKTIEDQDHDDDDDDGDADGQFARPTPPPLGDYGVELGPAIDRQSVPPISDPAAAPPPAVDDDDNADDDDDDDDDSAGGAG